MTWCRQHCSDDWYLTENHFGWEKPYSFHDSEDIYVFEFTSEQDYLLFNLKWK